jgi:hypothetical protein
VGNESGTIQGAPRPPEANYWDLLTRALPVAAALLPVIGVGIRWLNFAFDSTIPTQVILSASVPELALTGFRALLLVIPLAALITVLLFLERRRNRAALEGDHAVRAPVGRALILAFALIGLPIVVVQGELFGLVSGLGGGIVGFLARRLALRRVIGFADVFPLVLVLAISAVITSGIAPTTTRAASVQFVEGAGLRDGWYLPLGVSEHGLYLRACVGDQRVSLVRHDAVKLMVFAEDRLLPARHTLLDWLRGAPMGLGFISSCAG